MRKNWKLLVAAGAVFAAGISIGLFANKAIAWPFTWPEHYGFFERTHDDQGHSVIAEGINAGHASAYDINDFVSEMNAALYNSWPKTGAQDPVGAAFIILTMLGYDQNDSAVWGSSGWAGVAAARSEFSRWETLVRSYATAGRVNFNVWAGYTINTYYQGSPGPYDVSWYSVPVSYAWAIVFYSPDGGMYVIKHSCANPVGNLSPPQVLTDFNMNGRTTLDPADVSPKPGEGIVFHHYVSNAGPTPTSPYTVKWTAYNSLTGAATRGPIDAGAFTLGERNVWNEPYTVPLGTPPGTRICRHVGWTPDTEAGGSGVGASVCATVAYDFSLAPTINYAIRSGGVVVPGSTAQEGDQITFTYVVHNGGTTVSQSANCSTYGHTYAGAHDAVNPPVAPPPPGWAAGPATGCPRTFNAGATVTLVTETVTATPANSSICRSLYVSPARLGAPTPAGYEACVQVAAKPYAKVYGADVIAGGRLENSPGSATCALNTDAGVVGWNTRNATFTGAGTQYATFALDTINDFAASQGASGAPTPSGLAFRNSGITAGNQANGLFGGTFGSVPCIPDYYARKPSSTTALVSPINITTLVGERAYSASGNVIINGGNINPNNKISLYVDGNVYISSSITYVNNWSLATAPLFHLVVRGNIFIDASVDRLDGLFVAQQLASGAGGNIYTCTTAASRFAQLPLNGNLYNTCNNQLLVNGSFVATNNILLMRTYGTVSQSTGDTGYTVNRAAEVFNYNPIDWIVQPDYLDSTATGDYDSVTSLPPVL